MALVWGARRIGVWMFLALATVWLCLATAPAVMAQSTAGLIGFQKSICLVSDVGANPTATNIANCAEPTSIGIGDQIYYVLDVSNVSPISQTVTLNDTLPPSFVPIPGAQCFGSAFPVVSTVWSGSAGSATLPSGTSATCIIPGYFTATNPLANTASLAVAGLDTPLLATKDIYVDPRKPVAGNLSIVKTADITNASLVQNGGSITVKYSITVTNTGPNPLYTGGYLQVVDNLAALPSSGISFQYAVVTPLNCTTSGGTPLCPTLQSGSTGGNTTNLSTGTDLGVWEYNPGEAGLIPAGGSFEITFEVKYWGPEGCIYPNTLNGVRNAAYIRFATSQMAFSDSILADNTSIADLEITDHGVIDDCPEPPKPELTIEKVQKNPTGTVPWGTPVQYVITVTNPTGGTGTVSNITVTDLLASLPGMPIVDVWTQQVACLTPGNTCSPAGYVPIPVSPFMHTLNQYSAPVPVATVNIASLADGDSVDILVELAFKPKSCVSYDSASVPQTVDTARLQYNLYGKYGLIFPQDALSNPVITDHDKAPDCTLKATKYGPDEIHYGQPFSYDVIYENYGTDDIDVGSIIDAIALDSNVYAPSVSGIYQYACSISAGAFPTNLMATKPPTPFTVSYQNQPQQGTRLLQTINPNLPVTLPAGAQITCKFTLTLNQPPASNPFCQGAGDPRLVNSALMDVSHFYNTNLPNPPMAYSTTSASLPLCDQIKVTKKIKEVIVAPGTTVQVTLTLENVGDDPITGATLTDVLNPGMVYAGNWNCPLCSSPAPTMPATTLNATFGTLAGNQTTTATFDVQLPGPAPVVVPNTVKGGFTPPPGNWYDQGSTLQAADNVGVFDLFPAKITKKIINLSPGQPPLGPFTFAVNCTLPGYTTLQWSFTGTATATLASANTPVSVSVMNSNNTPAMLPAGAVCTFKETSLPGPSGAYGFSAVGYAPAALSGMGGQFTVGAGQSSVGLVENCYGSATANPLQVAHVVDKRCPPLVPVPPTVSVKKVCTPAVPGSEGGRPLYADCTIAVTSTGQFPVGMTVSEQFNGSSGTITHTSTTPATQTWACGTSPTAAPGPLNCSFQGGTQINPGPNSASFGYTVTFNANDEVNSAKNCALVRLGDQVLAEDCTGFELGEQARVRIEKTCGPVERRRFGVRLAMTQLANFSDCVIKVIANGPVIGPISVTESFGTSPNGSGLIYALTAAGWTCTPAVSVPVPGPVTCTMPGASFPSSGVSTIQATVLLPLGETSAKNCASVSVMGVRAEESCAEISVPVIDSSLKVKKLVVSTAPGSVAGLQFPISVSCTNSPGTAALDALSDGQTKPFWIYIPNTQCTVNEGAMPVTDACGTGFTPVWTQSYAPSQTVSMSPTGTLVTVTNTLRCDPVANGQLIVRKSIDASAAPGAMISGLTFPVKVTCGSADQTSTISTAAPRVLTGLSPTTPCSVSEYDPPTTGICPNGGLANWATSYSPATPVLPTQSGAVVSVLNKLTCPSPFALKITKTCDPALRKPMGPGLWRQPCQITITSTGGPVPANIVVTDALSGYIAPPSALIAPLPGSPWTCSAVPTGSVTCSIPGANFTSPSVLNIIARVRAPLPLFGKILRNCATVEGRDAANASLNPPLKAGPACAELARSKVVIIDTGHVTVPHGDLLAIPTLSVSKTCSPVVPVPGVPLAQAVCTITVSQTSGAPVNQIVVKDTLTSQSTGAVISSLTSAQGWSFPATPKPANPGITMQLPGAALIAAQGTSVITAAVQFPNADQATGAQNCVTVEGLDAGGAVLATTGPVCATLVNGSANVVPDPLGDKANLRLDHRSAGSCRGDREKQTYSCLFDIEVINDGAVDFTGPQVISQTFGKAAPLEASGKGDGWSCDARRQAASCVNGDLALLPGAGTGLEMAFTLPATREGGTFTSCARLGLGGDPSDRIMLVQQAANLMGLEIGAPDGVLGPKTRDAVGQMQERFGLTVTGAPDDALLSALGIDSSAKAEPVCVTVDLPEMEPPKCRKGEVFTEGTGCAAVRAPARPAPVDLKPDQPPEVSEKPLQCDPLTTVLRNGECLCRQEGMRKLDKETCGP